MATRKSFMLMCGLLRCRGRRWTTVGDARARGGGQREQGGKGYIRGGGCGAALGQGYGGGRLSRVGCKLSVNGCLNMLHGESCYGEQASGV